MGWSLRIHILVPGQYSIRREQRITNSISRFILRQSVSWTKRRLSGFLGGSAVKNPAVNAGGLGFNT